MFITILDNKLTDNSLKYMSLYMTEQAINITSMSLSFKCKIYI